MSYQPESKHTLLIASGPDEDRQRKHLFVTVAGPDQSGRVLLVPIASWRPEKYGFCDDQCVIHAGEHPFCTHESFVRYQRARFEYSADLEAQVEEGTIVRREDVSDELLARIRAGLAESAFAPLKYKKFLAAHVI